MHKIFVFTGIFGFAMFAIGFTLNYWISRRRFYRRSITGLQGFRSFESAWFTRLWEGIAIITAWGLIIFGLMELAGSILLPFSK